jgi:4-amino-4-deoxy-L-arabinose transferase-like glycosyltransferase
LVLPLLILLIGAAFRFHALAQDARFHPDEALFATFARKAAVNGDWLLRGSLDKTPLSIYAQALSMMLVGARPLPDGVLTLDVHAGEFAARLPGTFASILLIAVTFALTKRLYGYNPACIAAFLIALSPYALAFSATAFTDGLMLLCIVLALWMATRERWLWVGIWLALGYASKQQALFYVPLVIAIGWTVRARYIVSLRNMILFALPIILCFALLTIWDASRAQDTSLWTLAVANNDPGRLINIDQAIPRLQIWAHYAAYLLGSPLLTALLLPIGLLSVLHQIIRSPRARIARIDLILLLYILSYMLLHWLVALPTHDRYLLPILPPLILLVARGFDALAQIVGARYIVSSPKFSVPLLLCFSALCFFPSAIDATQSRLPMGGDRGEHDGIDQLSAYLESKPLGTIIYDHWLGWELGYYLGTWSNKRLTYYPNAHALAADAAAQSDPAPRYFPAPSRAAVELWLSELASVGFQIYEDYRSEGFIVYRLIP